MNTAILELIQTARRGAQLGAQCGALAMLVLLAGGCASSAADTAIVLSGGTGSARVVAVQGLEAASLDHFDRLESEQRQTVLRVWVADAPAGAPSVLGRATRQGDELIFTPRYPFQPGVKYRARFNGSVLSRGEGPIETEIAIPAAAAEATVNVDAVYPTSDELPENLLKFYIHFSGPMSRGEAYEHVHLIDDKGQTVAKPFLELEEELWNGPMTRFTLFFDPGRIKHGLVSQMQLGPAMEAGHTYRLVVDAAWRDAQGRHMAGPFTKTFRAGPSERRRPDPARWRVTPPRSGSAEALVVDFDEPLDHAMLQRVLIVRDGSGKAVAGTIGISEHERRWSFGPGSRWHAGRYTLSVETILEDVAGNSIGRAFEVDTKQAERAEGASVIEIPVDLR